jgi:predicted nucleic acid-binding protein
LAKVEAFLKEGPTADFVIGAHALVKGYTLLTLDEGMYRTAYPRLRIVTV